MSGDGSIAPSVRVDWGTPQASTSATTSAAPDTIGVPETPSVTPLRPAAQAADQAPAQAPDRSPDRPPSPRLDRVVADYLGSGDPVPDGAAHEIGDGDFRAIGAEFLRHFVELGGLTPEDDVLDIGCGFGRMALPLARYLAPQARYLGFDIVPEPVTWCRANVAPRRPGFGFEHLDAHHPLYNPDGTLPASAGFLGRIPAPLGWRPSFIAAVSVFTHLDHEAIRSILADARAILPHGGRLFLTAFLTGLRTPVPTEASAFPLAAWRDLPPLCALKGEPLTAAVGVSRRWLEEELGTLGYRVHALAFGHWRRGHDPDTPFQDVLVVGWP